MKYLFCLFVLCCVGCSLENTKESDGYLRIDTIGGHDYVSYWPEGGLVHAESCPCKVKAYKINNDGTTTEIK